MSSGCVLRKVNQLFTCEKRSNNPINKFKNCIPPGTYMMSRDENGTIYTGKLDIQYTDNMFNCVSYYENGVKVGQSNGINCRRKIYSGHLNEEVHNPQIEYTSTGFIETDYAAISMTNKTKYNVERIVICTIDGFNWTTYVINEDGSRTKVITGIAKKQK